MLNFSRANIINHIKGVYGIRNLLLYGINAEHCIESGGFRTLSQIRKRIWSSIPSDHRHSAKKEDGRNAYPLFWWGMVDSDHRSQ